ncbi:MAG: DUF1624 domain-containing protein [Candidatus Kapabacteria bacterium]|nr:DUF1624 domain-containing protein [Ignavibacteriota bacterium]MCW5883483.1 DUF1624 domain-containing protein [Candidatus Kapabacteria bacterium]
MNSPINSNREVYLDLAKFFAMIMMVAGHSFFELANPEFYNLKVFPWDWWNFARGKTAPMFLFLSGAVHVFANFKSGIEQISKDTFKRRILMAIVLLVIGYTLNSPINSLSELYSIQSHRLERFLQVNILHVFGVGLFILALIYRFAGSIKKVLIINLILGIFVILITPVIGISELNSIPKFISNYLNFKGGSLFTMLPYSAYMFLGTVFGIWLRSRKLSNNTLQLRTGLLMFTIGLFSILSGIAITKLLIYNGLRFDLRIDSGVVIRNIGIIILLISISRQIKITNIKIIQFISKLSKRAIYIYVIHLFMIYGIGPLAGFKYFYGKMFEPFGAMMMSFLIMILSVLFTILIDKILPFKITKILFLTILVAYSLIFIMN